VVVDVDELVLLIEEDFSIDEICERMRGPSTGGLVAFLGVVREENPEGSVKALDFEAYKEMAIREMLRLKQLAMERYRLENVAILHRVGRIPAGENIVLIVAAGAHREECFQAASYLIDELKRSVPIWKKEIYEEGERWVEGNH